MAELSKKAAKELSKYDKELQQQIVAELERAEKRRKVIVGICSIVAVVCIGYFALYSVMTEKARSQAQELSALKDSDALSNGVTGPVVHKVDGSIPMPDVLDEYKTLYNKNKSLIGWLKIDDTIVDYPVMQSQDSEYYLTHNFNQEYDKNGSLFLDPKCNVLDTGKNLIIYGHHMQSGQMFGGLYQYQDESYYRKHKIIQFDTIYEKGTYEVMYVFRTKVYRENDVVFKYYQFTKADSAKEFDSYMKEMAEMSYFDTNVTAVYGDDLLTLSTCDYEENNGRFVVVAKKITEE